MTKLKAEFFDIQEMRWFNLPIATQGHDIFATLCFETLDKVVDVIQREKGDLLMEHLDELVRTDKNHRHWINK